MLLTGLSLFVLLVAGSFLATLMPTEIDPTEADA
jgi:hypothetical protein